jgi:hypothetical protein
MEIYKSPLKISVSDREIPISKGLAIKNIELTNYNLANLLTHLKNNTVPETRQVLNIKKMGTLIYNPYLILIFRNIKTVNGKLCKKCLWKEIITQKFSKIYIYTC